MRMNDAAFELALWCALPIPMSHATLRCLPGCRGCSTAFPYLPCCVPCPVTLNLLPGLLFSHQSMLHCKCVERVTQTLPLTHIHSCLMAKLRGWEGTCWEGTALARRRRERGPLELALVVRCALLPLAPGPRSAHAAAGRRPAAVLGRVPAKQLLHLLQCEACMQGTVGAAATMRCSPGLRQKHEDRAPAVQRCTSVGGRDAAAAAAARGGWRWGSTAQQDQSTTYRQTAQPWLCDRKGSPARPHRCLPGRPLLCAPFVSGREAQVQAKPAQAMPLYRKKAPEPPSRAVRERKVCATAALLTQLAVAARPAGRGRLGDEETPTLSYTLL